MNLLEERGEQVTFGALQEAISDSAASELLPRLMMFESPESFDEAREEANNCMRALDIVRLDREIEAMSFQIIEADQAGDLERRDRLVQAKEQLKKDRRLLL